MIAEYYNSAAGTDAYYDLELVGIPEMQIHKMYSEHPLHTVYKDTDTPLKDWTVHLLVAGFGQLGQQAVLQAMNLGEVRNSFSSLDGCMRFPITHSLPTAPALSAR